MNMHLKVKKFNSIQTLKFNSGQTCESKGQFVNLNTDSLCGNSKVSYSCQNSVIHVQNPLKKAAFHLLFPETYKDENNIYSSKANAGRTRQILLFEFHTIFS